MKKTLFALLIVIIVGIAAIWVLVDFPQPVDETTSSTINQVTYVDTAGKTVTAMFTADSVTFSSDATGTVNLPLAISASGARYANEDESWVFWNKGNEVTITHNGEIIFQGSVNEVANDENPSQKLAPGSEPAATAAQLSGTSWVWQQTILSDDTTVVPSKANAFTIKFGADGRTNGTTDCNGFSGGYKVASDGFIAVGPLASTMMFCQNSQEAVFTKQLSDTSRFMFDKKGNLVLVMKNNLGAILFVKK